MSSGNCAKLKWNRKTMGLSQKQFAEKVELNVNTIKKLENDEEAWNTIRPETADKIYALYRSMGSWQPDNAHEVIQDINKESESAEKAKSKPKKEIVHKPVKNNGVNEQDQKTLTLIEFAYEGLKESKTHEDFVANIALIKRILSKY